ncbi:MAG: hypothetical protein ABSF72_19310 [Candidatus Sulfotelmatobacter sp.]|jgi:hypothetical protein
MAYWDPFYPARTLFSDIRAHLANWRRFKRATRTWPTISIATYVMRFFLIVGGVVLGIWYQVRHDLTKGQGLLIYLAVLLPVVFIWFVVEHVAWNFDLRRKGISSDRDIWKIRQFPQE